MLLADQAGFPSTALRQDVAALPPFIPKEPL